MKYIVKNVPKDDKLKIKKKEKITDANEFNEWINKEETGINRELFNKHFHYQTPSALFKDLYNTNDKEKNSLLVSVINSGIQDLKKEISKMSEDEKKLKSQIKQQKLLKRFLSLIKKNNQDKD